MFHCAIVLLVLGSTLGLDPEGEVDLDLDLEWRHFKSLYSKNYVTQEEELARRAVWEANLNMIKLHNLQADKGAHSYRLGMNQLGDMTTEEIQRQLNGYRPDLRKPQRAADLFVSPRDGGSDPASVDWRTKGYVTPVKNQGKCGSCWAFSSTGSLEGQTFKRTGKLISLSEQNLIDCSKPQGNHGCEGGLMDLAFEYVELNMGLDTEQSYPYKGKDGSCQYSPANNATWDDGWTDIERFNETALQSAVATVGPISIAIDASRPTFHFYKTGVYYDPKCSSKKLDHGVLAVGYGTDQGDAFWLVKNSWGPQWGMDGYIQMAKDRDNACGIATQASYPKVFY